jgi:proteasome lid subunit RPN8/RPN11
MIGPETLQVAASVEDGILEHARSRFPDEAVGFLAGPHAHLATHAFPMANLMSGDAFLVDPLSQFNATKAIERAGLRIVGIYHSHPRGDARLSRIDEAFARGWGVPQLVVAWAPGLDQPEFRAYVPSPAGAVELSLVVGSAG